MTYKKLSRRRPARLAMGAVEQAALHRRATALVYHGPRYRRPCANLKKLRRRCREQLEKMIAVGRERYLQMAAQRVVASGAKV